jgi:hypothetical protein
MPILLTLQGDVLASYENQKINGSSCEKENSGVRRSSELLGNVEAYCVLKCAAIISGRTYRLLG